MAAKGPAAAMAIGGPGETVSAAGRVSHSQTKGTPWDYAATGSIGKGALPP